MSAPIASQLAPPQTSYLFPALLHALKSYFFVSGGSKETLAKFDLYYFAVCEHFQSDHHEHRQREANLEMQVETLVFSEMHGKFWY